VAVFGNTGGGKSTLARRLTELTDPQHAQQLPRDLAMSPPLDAEVQTARRGARQHKRVHHLRSADAMDAFLNAVRLEAQRAWPPSYDEFFVPALFGQWATRVAAAAQPTFVGGCRSWASLLPRLRSIASCRKPRKRPRRASHQRDEVI